MEFIDLKAQYRALQPEIDGNIYFGSETPCAIGEFVNVRITGARAYDLMGERV